MRRPRLAEVPPHAVEVVIGNDAEPPLQVDAQSPLRCRMGLPERLVDRQLAKRGGRAKDAVASVRTGQNLLTVAMTLGLMTSSLQLLTGTPDRLLWTVLGLGWLCVAYLLFRQRRYLNGHVG